ncbi:MAG: GNAT family N-acetyltransferase [Acidimicrobiales bacterium]
MEAWRCGRGERPRDAATLAAAWADLEVERWTQVPEARSEADAARWVAGEAHRRDRGVGIDLVVTVPGDPGAVIGEVGLAVVEPVRRWAEVGYWVLPEHRGRGRATAALWLFTHWVLTEVPIQRLFARTDPANVASGRVAAAAGYDHVGDLADGTVVWVRDRGSAPTAGGTVGV